jgi:mono/diheme cytochrome c family protein
MAGVTDKPLPKSELASLLQQLLLVILGVVVIVSLTWSGVRVAIRYLQMQDPYIQQVMTTIGETRRGQAIFIANCSGCHGYEAMGRVGPSLRHIGEHKSQLQLIKQVISGQTPPMPKFQPSPQEMSDLLAYLESL